MNSSISSFSSLVSQHSSTSLISKSSFVQEDASTPRISNRIPSKAPPKLDLDHFQHPKEEEPREEEEALTENQKQEEGVALETKHKSRSNGKNDHINRKQQSNNGDLNGKSVGSTKKKKTTTSTSSSQRSRIARFSSDKTTPIIVSRPLAGTAIRSSSSTGSSSTLQLSSSNPLSESLSSAILSDASNASSAFSVEVTSTSSLSQQSNTDDNNDNQSFNNENFHSVLMTQLLSMPSEHRSLSNFDDSILSFITILIHDMVASGTTFAIKDLITRIRHYLANQVSTIYDVVATSSNRRRSRNFMSANSSLFFGSTSHASLSTTTPLSLTTHDNGQQDAALKFNKRRVSKGVRGIPNYGQTCFLNSVLQSLASLESFVAYVERIVELHYSKNNNAMTISTPQQPLQLQATGKRLGEDENHLFCFSELLLDLLQAVNGMCDDDVSVIDPREMLYRIGKKHSQFRARSKFSVGNEQQDAEELLQALLDIVITEAELDSTSSSLESSFASSPSSSPMARQQLEANAIDHHQSHRNESSTKKYYNYNYHDNDEVLTAVSGIYSDRLRQRLSFFNYEDDNDDDDDDDDDENGGILISKPLGDGKQNIVRNSNGQSSHQQQHYHNTFQVPTAKQQHLQKLHMDDESSDTIHQREEKKQEDFELGIMKVDNTNKEMLLSVGEISDDMDNGNNNFNHGVAQIPPATMEQIARMDLKRNNNISSKNFDSNNIIHDSSKYHVEKDDDDNNKLSASMQIMMSTISSNTPSPICGWLGSSLQCRACKYVHPIKNEPFLAIPIVPASVSRYLANCCNSGRSGGGREVLTKQYPSCTLDECLREFTIVERVHDVECLNCTIKEEMRYVQQEVCMLQTAINMMLAQELKRNMKKKGKNGHTTTSKETNGSGDNENVKGLRCELLQAETQLLVLKNMDPDDPDTLEKYFQYKNNLNKGIETYDLTMDNMLSSDNGYVGIDESTSSTSSSPSLLKKKLHRCEANKRLLLTRLPAVLCIHVHRRHYDPLSNHMCKTMQHVDFPDLLDVSPYCAYSSGGACWGTSNSSNNSKKTGSSWAGSSSNSSTTKFPILYKLTCVIEHNGNANYGHYVCYRRDPSSASNNWYKISDASVQPISWSNVQKCQAYMLFYEAM